MKKQEQFNMSKLGKWIAGGFGFVLAGPIAGIVMFALGWLVEGNTKFRNPVDSQATQGDFVMSLLVLLSAVMKADGKILKSELDFVKNYFVQTFGVDATKEMMIVLRDILKQDIPIEDVSRQVAANMDYASRLQLIHLLFGVSRADGHVDVREVYIIQRISEYFEISVEEFESLKSMFFENPDSLYKILEIPSDSTDAEVKTAYRKLANKHHPDKVAYLGDEVKQQAEIKFQKINEAYEKIKKERGMK